MGAALQGGGLALLDGSLDLRQCLGQLLQVQVDHHDGRVLPAGGVHGGQAAQLGRVEQRQLGGRLAGGLDLGWRDRLRQAGGRLYLGLLGSLAYAPGGGALQGAAHVPDAERLAQVVVHAVLQALLALLAQGAGGDGDQVGRACAGRGIQDAPAGLQAVHHRHLDVHQDHIIRLALHGLQGFQAVLHQVGAVAQLAQHQHGQLLVDGVVLGHQDAQGQALAHVAVDDRFGAGGGGDLRAPGQAGDEHLGELGGAHRLADKGGDIDIPQVGGAVNEGGQHDQRQAGLDGVQLHGQVQALLGAGQVEQDDIGDGARLRAGRGGGLDQGG